MRASDKTIEISASDLSNFLSCRHRTGLDLAVARGLLAAPSWIDPMVEVLQQRGLEHEASYADSLREQGLEVVDLAGRSGGDLLLESIDAMRSGADVILQPALRVGKWFGRPDILRRVIGLSTPEENCIARRSKSTSLSRGGALAGGARGGSSPSPAR